DDQDCWRSRYDVRIVRSLTRTMHVFVSSSCLSRSAFLSSTPRRMALLGLSFLLGTATAMAQIELPPLPVPKPSPVPDTANADFSIGTQFVPVDRFINSSPASMDVAFQLPQESESQAGVP